MQIDIQARGVNLTQHLREYVQDRLHFGIGRLPRHDLRIAVRLTDINGPKGGMDKRCQLHVRVAGLADVVVDDVQTDMYEAINRAVERATRTVWRSLRRARLALIDLRRGGDAPQLQRT